MIRPVTLRDLAQIMEIEEECFDETKGDAWDLESYVDWFAQPFTGGFVYETNPRAVAAVALFDAQPIGRKVELVSIAVRKSWRQHKLGHAMLRAVLGEAAIREMRRIWLNVAADNTIARKLYVAHGFKTVATEENYYIKGRAAHTMERDL